MFACSVQRMLYYPQPKAFSFRILFHKYTYIHARTHNSEKEEEEDRRRRMVEIEKVLHMNGGDGNTSYAINSLHPVSPLSLSLSLSLSTSFSHIYQPHFFSFQRTVASMVKPILEESIEQLYITLIPECLKMADLGCSTGFNTLLVVSDVLEIIGTKSKMLNLPPPSLQAFLNDLPGNDFNTIFRSLPSFYTKLENEKGSSFGHCFITTVAGSFYGRLFPSNSLHFVHSSYALMWISMVSYTSYNSLFFSLATCKL